MVGNKCMVMFSVQHLTHYCSPLWLALVINWLLLDLLSSLCLSLVIFTQSMYYVNMSEDFSQKYLRSQLKMIIRGHCLFSCETFMFVNCSFFS